MAPARRRSPFRRGPSRATDAVVARIHDYAESSAVAVLLTADRGTVHAIARGARRVANGFRGPLDRGVLYRVRIGRAGERGLFQLNTATVREPYARLRADPARFLAAALVLEVAADLMRDEEPHEELFRLTVFTLKVLDRAPHARLDLATTLFLVRAVALSGHAPELDHCVACGDALDPDERPFLSALRGGTLHAACAQGEPGARTVSRGVLDLHAALARRPVAEALELACDVRTLRDLRRVLIDWLQNVLERGFRAAAAAEREFGRAGP